MEKKSVHRIEHDRKLASLTGTSKNHQFDVTKINNEKGSTSYLYNLTFNFPIVNAFKEVIEENYPMSSVVDSYWLN